jgi:hypothetical protein
MAANNNKHAGSKSRVLLMVADRNITMPCLKIYIEVSMTVSYVKHQLISWSPTYTKYSNVRRYEFSKRVAKESLVTMESVINWPAKLQIQDQEIYAYNRGLVGQN